MAKRRDEIRLSPEHGLNPSLGVCFWCGEDDGSVVLPGLMKGDKEAPHRAVWSMEPCKACVEKRAQGITLIECEETDDELEPTGTWFVVTEDFVRRVFSDEGMIADTMRHRVANVSVDAVDLLGLRDAPPTHPQESP